MQPIEDIIRHLGAKKSFQKGEHLFNAGDTAKGMYYVESGAIRVYRMDDEGKEVEVVRLEDGDFLGEAVLFVSPAYPAFAQAVKDSEVWFIPKEALFQQLEKDPVASRFFLTLLAQKCVTLNQRIEALGLNTVKQRLAQYLLARCSGDRECQIDLDIKKHDLARLLGTISETLSRNLRQMQEQGLIEVRGTRIIVKDRRRLQEEISSPAFSAAP